MGQSSAQISRSCKSWSLLPQFHSSFQEQEQEGMLGFHGLRQIQRRLAISPHPHRATTSTLLRTITPAAFITSLSLHHHQRTFIMSSGNPTMASEVQKQLQQLQLQDKDLAEGAAVAGGSVESESAMLAASASGRPVYPRRIPMPIAVAPMVDVTTSVSHSLGMTTPNTHIFMQPN